MKYDNLEISTLWAKLSLRKGFRGTHYSTTTGGLPSCHCLSSSSTLPLVFCFEACNLCCCICCCSVFKYIELTVQECFLLLLYAFYYYYTLFLEWWSLSIWNNNQFIPWHAVFVSKADYTMRGCDHILPVQSQSQYIIVIKNFKHQPLLLLAKIKLKTQMKNNG